LSTTDQTDFELHNLQWKSKNFTQQIW
jgi:hypothetical protein